MPLLQQSVVAYDEIEAPRLKKALFLADAISDLPEVSDLCFPTVTFSFLTLVEHFVALFLIALYVITSRLETINPKM
jgi:hypothetical protein